MVILTPCAVRLLQVSAGGLVSALMGVGNFQTKWIGWPGARFTVFPLSLPATWPTFV